MKTQKHILVVLILTYCPLLLFGQLKHELKIEPLNLFSTFTPSYELIINEKIGIEVEMSFDSRKAGIYIPDTTIAQFPFFNIEEYNRKRVTPAISGKYYLLFNDHGNGFYVGPHFKSIFNTFIDDALEERYLQINNSEPPYWGRKGFQNFFLGLNAGFKWLIKERFIIESASFLTENYVKEDGKFEAKGYDFDLEIKVGYRF